MQEGKMEMLKAQLYEQFYVTWQRKEKQCEWKWICRERMQDVKQQDRKSQDRHEMNSFSLIHFQGWNFAVPNFLISHKHKCKHM